MKNKKIGVIQIILLMIFMIISAGCHSTPIATPVSVPASTEPPYPIYPTEDYSSGIRDLQENQAKWESQQITHYEMTVDGYEEFLPMIVEVKDGDVVSVVNAQGKKVLMDSDEMRNYPHLFSIPALFSYLSQTYADSPPSMSVDYDPVLGYPVSIHIDPFTEPCCQDFSFYIQDFHILSP